MPPDGNFLLDGAVNKPLQIPDKQGQADTGQVAR